ncbi:MAG: hypothetical protein B7Z29_18280 [Hyphomicrobium sp. 12-62-95]|nr:MAG: hypothetical protein B7Z29_18280 [Hyphomicrobium sp. 12-62-95]
MSRPIKGRGGRPIKQPDEKRCVQVNTRMTIADYDMITAKAAEANLSVSEFMRRAALGHRIVVPVATVYAPLIRALISIGNNINQIARSSNRGQEEQAYWRAIGDRVSFVLTEVVKTTK